MIYDLHNPIKMPLSLIEAIKPLVRKRRDKHTDAKLSCIYPNTKCVKFIKLNDVLQSDKMKIRHLSISFIARFDKRAFKL